MMFNQIIQFVQNHLLLSAALLVVIVAIIVEERKNQSHGAHNISAQDLVRLLNDKKAIIIDIRESAIFQKEHILSSINIPASTNPEEMLKKLQQHKGKQIIIIGHDAGSAMKLVSSLRRNGFNQVNMLTGGINGWKNNNLPLTDK